MDAPGSKFGREWGVQGQMGGIVIDVRHQSTVSTVPSWRRLSVIAGLGSECCWRTGPADLWYWDHRSRI